MAICGRSFGHYDDHCSSSVTVTVTMCISYSATTVTICSNILNTFLFLFSNKMLAISAGINKLLVRIANSEDPD